MKIAILTSRYPSKDSPYNHMFVHARSLELIKDKSISLTVYVPKNKTLAYTYEGINVVESESENIANVLKKYDVVYLHLLNIYPFEKSDGWLIYKRILKDNINYVMYVHGSEVQKYGARMFEFRYQPTDFLKWFKKDVLVIPKIKKFVTESIKKGIAKFIYPSVWMKEEMEKNLDLEIKKYSIVPNGIDTDLFHYYDCYPNKYKLLTLRPLDSKKYAVDKAIEIMYYLPKKYTLDIYGKGFYKKQYLEKIYEYELQDRVQIIESFIDRSKLNEHFSNYGVFLCPTRMDAQGVSMCEAMATGLLTVSSYNTAIPEFVRNLETGIVSNDLLKLASDIENVIQDKVKYNQITSEARKSMEAISIFNTMKKELDILKNK